MRKKNLCAIWELDRDSASRLQRLCMRMADTQFVCSSFHPHITLGCYLDIEDRQLRPWVRAFAGRVSPFSVRFEEVGMLGTDIPACFPRYEGPLKRHYEAFHERFDDYADQWTRTDKGLYTPHVSLHCGPAEMTHAAQKRLIDSFTPFEGRVQALSLSWIRGEEDYVILARYPLKEQAK